MKANPDFDLAAYRSKYYPSYKEEQLAGEATTGLLFDPEAPARLVAANPDASIVVIVRSHADALYSWYLHQCRDGELPKSFNEIVEDEIAFHESNGNIGQDYGYMRRYRYAEQIDRYVNAYGPDSVYVLQLEQLSKSTAATLNQLCCWLGVGEFDWPEAALVPQNTASRNRQGFVTRLSHSTRRSIRSIPFSSRLPVRWRQSFHGLLDAVETQRITPAPLPSSLRRRIGEQFLDDVDQLRVRYGVNFDT